MNVRELRRALSKLPSDLPVMHPVGVAWVELQSPPQVVEMRETYTNYWQPNLSSTRRPATAKKAVVIGLVPDEEK